MYRVSLGFIKVNRIYLDFFTPSVQNSEIDIVNSFSCTRSAITAISIVFFISWSFTEFQKFLPGFIESRRDQSEKTRPQIKFFKRLHQRDFCCCCRFGFPSWRCKKNRKLSDSRFDQSPAGVGPVRSRGPAGAAPVRTGPTLLRNPSILEEAASPASTIFLFPFPHNYRTQ